MTNFREERRMAAGVRVHRIYTRSGAFSAGRLLCVVSSLLALWILHALILLHDPGNDLLCVSCYISCISSLVCIAREPSYVSLNPCCCCTCANVLEDIRWRVKALVFPLTSDYRQNFPVSVLVS